MGRFAFVWLMPLRAAKNNMKTDKCWCMEGSIRVEVYSLAKKKFTPDEPVGTVLSERGLNSKLGTRCLFEGL
jgi:hypothetical protein